MSVGGSGYTWAVLDLEKLAPETVRPLRRSEYDQIVELGLFASERVELLYGTLVKMTPQGTGHMYVVRRLNRILLPLVAARADVSVQAPLAASDESEPEPDFALIPRGDYLDEKPTTALLVVEVADSSLRKDRDIKARLYAEMGIPEYWLVNLVDSTVEVRRSPKDGVYTKVSIHQRDETLALLAFPDISVALAEILPP